MSLNSTWTYMRGWCAKRCADAVAWSNCEHKFERVGVMNAESVQKSPVAGSSSRRQEMSFVIISQNRSAENRADYHCTIGVPQKDLWSLLNAWIQNFLELCFGMLAPKMANFMVETWSATYRHAVSEKSELFVIIYGAVYQTFIYKGWQSEKQLKPENSLGFWDINLLLCQGDEPTMILVMGQKSANVTNLSRVCSCTCH